MNTYSTAEMIGRITRSLESGINHRWIDVEVLPVDPNGGHHDLRNCLELLPALGAALMNRGLEKSTFAPRRMFVALKSLLEHPLMMGRSLDKEEHGLLMICYLALTKYRHGVHNCIEEAGELAELVRSHYLKIELGEQLDAICGFYTVNLAFIPNHLRLPFLTEGEQYIAALTGARFQPREADIHRLPLTLVATVRFADWNENLSTNPALTAMFVSSMGTMAQFTAPIWVEGEYSVAHGLLRFSDLVLSLQDCNLKIGCSGADWILICQMLEGMRVAAGAGTVFTGRIVRAAEALAAMVAPEVYPATSTENGLRPCIGSEDWLQPSEASEVMINLFNIMEQWSAPTPLAPSLQLVRQRVVFDVFQAAAESKVVRDKVDFKYVAKGHINGLNSECFVNALQRQGWGFLSEFAIYAKDDDLKQALAKTGDMQIRSRVFGSDLGL